MIVIISFYACFLISEIQMNKTMNSVDIRIPHFENSSEINNRVHKYYDRIYLNVFKMVFSNVC